MTQNVSEELPLQHEGSGILGDARPSFRDQLLICILIAAIGIAYVSSLSPGHVFANDDFAAYVMHASNLAEGRPYAALHYIANPQAEWLAPFNGYPPVFPMMLAPICKFAGLNLRAFKVLTVACFVVFLCVLAVYLRSESSTLLVACVLLLIAGNPIFWEYRQYILSEFPYLMCSFGALLVMQLTQASVGERDLKLGSAVLLALLLYGAYGVRTIGIALLGALILADIAKFRRPRRFLMVTVVFTLALMLVQNIAFTSPGGYLSAFRFSPRMMLTNTLYYGKTLSYVWQNGFSKSIQIGFALLFTVLAAVRFIARLSTEQSAREFYLLLYIAILIAWNAEIGLRGLLPVLPLYFVYGLEGLDRLRAWARPSLQPAVLLSVMAFGVLTYSGEFKRESMLPPEPNVLDPTAQEMFSFVRSGTARSEVAIFAKPRTLALFTGRDAASLAFDETTVDSTGFMRKVNATIIIQSAWGPPSWPLFLAANPDTAEIFRNSEYRVFRISRRANPMRSPQ